MANFLPVCRRSHPLGLDSLAGDRLGDHIAGFPPNAEELWRMLIFTAVGIFYVGFWLALAMLFSLLFQKTVTAALASMAVGS